MLKIQSATATPRRTLPTRGPRPSLKPFLILTLLAATLSNGFPPARVSGDTSAPGLNQGSTSPARNKAGRRKGFVSPASQRVFDEVKARLLAVAARETRRNGEQFVWPPPIELDGSPDFDAYACRCYVRADGTEDIPMRDGKFLPHIVITQGAMTNLIEDNPDRLAVVMGHEIAHVIHGHVLPNTARERAGQGELVTLMKVFSREEEHEADVLGMKLALKANYSIKGAREVWVRINSKEFLTLYPNFNYTSFEGASSTHPAWSDRLELIDKEKQTLWKAMSSFENGVYLLAFQKYAEAEEAFMRVVARKGCDRMVGGKPNCHGFPDSYDAQANLGYALLMQYLDKLEPSDMARFGVGHLVTGAFYKRPGSLETQVKGVDTALWNRAVRELEKALKSNPGATLARANLGIAYLLAPTGRNVPEALKHLEPAVAALAGDQTLTNENRAAVLINAAVASLAGGDADKAAARLGEAAELMDNEDMFVALKYNRALLLSRSAETDKRAEAVSLLTDYLKQQSPISLWWEAAYALYSDLATKADGTPAPKNDFLNTWRREKQLRPVTSVEAGPGVLIMLNETATSVQEKLGRVTPVPVIGEPQQVLITRLFYPERGLEFLAARRVVAIILRGQAAPPLKLQRAEVGAPVSVLRIGMPVSEVDKLIGEQPVPVRLAGPNDNYDFYPEAGVAVRYDANDRVDELAIVRAN